MLELMKYELRDDKLSFQKPGLADIGYPAVDYHAGIEYLYVAGFLRGLEDVYRLPEVELVALLGAEDKPEVAQYGINEKPGYAGHVRRDRQAFKGQRDKGSKQYSSRQPDYGTSQSPYRRLADCKLQQYGYKPY